MFEIGGRTPPTLANTMNTIHTTNNNNNNNANNNNNNKNNKIDISMVVPSISATFRLPLCRFGTTVVSLCLSVPFCRVGKHAASAIPLSIYIYIYIYI